MTTRTTAVIAIASAVAGVFLTLLFTNYSSSSNSICLDYSTDAPSELTTELIHDMVEQYNRIQYNSIGNATLTPIPKDARAIWFDLETIKKFVYHIEHDVKKKTDGDTKSDALGIRIYYAAYPENKRMEELGKFQKDTGFSFDPTYEGLHTLVMIPTIADKEGNNMDFNPDDLNTYVGFTKMPIDQKYPFVSNENSILGLGGTGSVASSGSSSVSSRARNHGTLSPPNTEFGFGF